MTPRRLPLLLTIALAPLTTGCLFQDAAERLGDLYGVLRPADLNLSNADACSELDLARVATYVECLEADRARRCAEAGVELDRCDARLLAGEEEVTGCAPPVEIEQTCAAALAPVEPPTAGEPLDCDGARRAAAAQYATKFDDPAAQLDPAAWAVLGVYVEASTFGITARYEAEGARACYVAFRGTDSVDDVRIDLRSATHGPCGELPGRCGNGFVAAFEQAVASGIYDDTIALVEGGECDTLTVVGHSLGGAIADLFAAHLHHLDPERYGRGFLDLQTFGQPRTFEGGDGRLAERMHVFVPKTRWVRWGDPVPATPPVGFVHTGTARLLNHGFDWTTRTTGWRFGILPRNAGGQGFWPANHRMVHYVDALDACH